MASEADVPNEIAKPLVELAAALTGGLEPLARELGVTVALLDWITRGRQPMKAEIYHRALEIIRTRRPAKPG
jgi:hypothetical protein